MQEIRPGIHVESKYQGLYNLGLVTLDEGVLAVGVPPRPNQARAWLDYVQETVGEIRYVLLMDARREYILVTAALDYPIITSEALLRQIQSYDERSWRDLLQEMGERYPEDAEIIHTLRPRQPKISFNNRFRLHHRATPLELEIAAGSAPGSVWLLVPEHQLLFVGDSVSLDHPPAIDTTPDLGAWQESLRKLSQRKEVKQIIPSRGHAPILRGEVEQQLEFMRIAQETAYKLAKKGNGGFGHTAQDLGQTFFNSAGNKGVQQIRAGLERIAADISNTEEESEE